MVYRGKPSKACHECRQKRRRCDLQKPTCGQCRRSGTPCRGYRQDIDTLFIGQPESTKFKDVLRSTTPATPQAQAVSAPNRTASPPASAILAQVLPAPAAGDFALAYFCRNNACSAAVSALLDVPTPSAQQAVLVTCMRALGSATCAIANNSERMGLEAGRYYSASLAAMNEALASPMTAKCDDILRAVMILCCFDTTSSRALAFSHQAAHINGCAALLGARGIEQMRSPHGRVLFVQACVNVVSHCLRTRSRIPPIIHDLTESSIPYFDENRDRAIWVAHKVRLTVTDYYCAYTEDRIDLDYAVNNMLHFDSELAALLDYKSFDITYNLPASEQLPAKSPTMSWQLFQEQSIYHALCAYRVMLHLLIRNIAQPLASVSGRWATQLVSSTTIINDFQAEILSTMPQRVSYAQELSNHNSSTEPESHVFDVLSPPLGISHAEAAMANIALAESLSGNKIVLSAEEGPAVLRLSRGYGLIWQLMLVGVCAEPGSKAQDRSIKLLRSTGKDLSIPQAVILADRLGPD